MLECKLEAWILENLGFTETNAVKYTKVKVICSHKIRAHPASHPLMRTTQMSTQAGRAFKVCISQHITSHPNILQSNPIVQSKSYLLAYKGS